MASPAAEPGDRLLKIERERADGHLDKAQSWTFTHAGWQRDSEPPVQQPATLLGLLHDLDYDEAFRAALRLFVTELERAQQRRIVEKLEDNMAEHVRVRGHERGRQFGRTHEQQGTPQASGGPVQRQDDDIRRVIGGHTPPTVAWLPDRRQRELIETLKTREREYVDAIRALRPVPHDGRQLRDLEQRRRGFAEAAYLVGREIRRLYCPEGET